MDHPLSEEGHSSAAGPTAQAFHWLEGWAQALWPVLPPQTSLGQEQAKSRPRSSSAWWGFANREFGEMGGSVFN